MKTRIIVLCIVVCAIVTLSFTVASVKTTTESQKSEQSAPVGGLVAEDKL